MTVMPDFPARGSMEWRDELKTYLDAIQSRGELPPVDLDTVAGFPFVGTWSLPNDGGYTNVPAEALASGEELLLVVDSSLSQRTSSQRLVWSTGEMSRAVVRTVSGEPSWGPWRVGLSVADAAMKFGRSASEQIKDLAVRDGWAAVWDPSDPVTRYYTEEGVLYVEDGMGEFNTLQSTTLGMHPTVVSGEFGQLDGITGGVIQNVLGGNRTIGKPVTVLMVLKSYDPSPSSSLQIPFAGRGTPRVSPFLMVRADDTYGAILSTNNTQNANTPAIHDTRAKIVRATFNSEDEGGVFSVNGEFIGTTRAPSGPGITGVTLGAQGDGNSLFNGSIGPLLLLEGETDLEARVGRMTALLMALTGIAPPRHLGISSRAAVYSVDDAGMETFVAGDPDRIDEEPTVASITKTLTLWLARKHLSNSDMSTLVTVDGDDLRGSSPTFGAGDQVSYMDLFHAAAKPSDNSAPNIIARGVGMLIDSSDPRQAFIDAMNDEIAALGYYGASVPNPQYNGLFSARQVVDLFRRCMDDPVLEEAFTVGSHDITIHRDGGGTDTVTVTSSLTSNSPYPKMGLLTGKTGTNYGFGHVVCMWEGEGGRRNFTAVLSSASSPSWSRYRDLYKAISEIRG